ncbi:hypothetical protein [Nostoc sp. C057]|uniref:hypothetical protein n=1 Tax=Nostoc sp. C057 TaxID=2576903 RepID=UPI0015C3091B|nr:hypothetical protein [Nostoc sp. C057]
MGDLLHYRTNVRANKNKGTSALPSTCAKTQLSELSRVSSDQTLMNMWLHGETAPLQHQLTVETQNTF